jgi:hypothetical protein
LFFPFSSQPVRSKDARNKVRDGFHSNRHDGIGRVRREGTRPVLRYIDNEPEQKRSRMRIRIALAIPIASPIGLLHQMRGVPIQQRTRPVSGMFDMPAGGLLSIHHQHHHVPRMHRGAIGSAAHLLHDLVRCRCEGVGTKGRDKGCTEKKGYAIKKRSPHSFRISPFSLSTTSATFCLYPCSRYPSSSRQVSPASLFRSLDSSRFLQLSGPVTPSDDPSDRAIPSSSGCKTNLPISLLRRKIYLVIRLT